MNPNDTARLGREKGDRAEERFLRLFSGEDDRPHWMLRVERATEKGANDEDIDFFVHTKDGRRFPVNVKSSYAGRRNFIRKHGNSTVCIIIVRDGVRDKHVRIEASRFLSAWLSKLPL